MIRYLLPVVATLLLAGCNCNTMVCSPSPDGGDWDTSAAIAGDLWEAERNRQGKPTGEATPDTIEVPAGEAPTDTVPRLWR